MKCYDCDCEASAKIGTAKANILQAFGFGGKAWEKFEIYVCKAHHLERLGKKQ